MLNIIGSTEYIDVAGVKNVPAKIDTGADSSAIWASNIDMSKDGILSFVLFDKESPFYTGERIQSNNYVAKIVRSSHGDEQIRYRVELPVVINGESFLTTFTLANRAKNQFAILVGRRTLKGRFLVDVSKRLVKQKKDLSSSQRLNQKLQENPYEFHKKYLKN